MKRTPCSDAQIVGILQEAAGAGTVRAVRRRHGITEPTCYRWRATYGGMPKAGLRRRTQREDENRRLKQLVADLSLDVARRNDVVGRRWCRRGRGGAPSPIAGPPPRSATAGPAGWCSSRARAGSTGPTGPTTGRWRVSRETELRIRKRRRRTKVSTPRVSRPLAAAGNTQWTLDFISDAFASGRAFRVLRIVDAFTRECLALRADVS